jgi:hypothetical protein
MGQLRDLTGQKFGRLTVLYRNGSSKSKSALWFCVCEDGNTCTVVGSDLISGHSKSYGCYKKDISTERLSGELNPAKTEEFRARMRDNNPAKRSEVREKISKNHADVSGCNNPMFGVASPSTGKFGPESPNWRGGVTPENMMIRTSSEYKTWRSQVFARDYGICNDCFTQSPDVEAHHLFSFSEWEELRLDVDNGMTLCKKCHDSYAMKGTYNHKR